MPWLICVRDPQPKGSKAESVWTQFASPAELMKADQVLLDDRLGCGDPLCARRHILAWSDESGTHIQSSRHDPVERLTLEEEIQQLYPRRPLRLPPPGRVAGRPRAEGTVRAAARRIGAQRADDARAAGGANASCWRRCRIPPWRQRCATQRGRPVWRWPGRAHAVSRAASARPSRGRCASPTTTSGGGAACWSRGRRRSRGSG